MKYCLIGSLLTQVNSWADITNSQPPKETEVAQEFQKAYWQIKESCSVMSDLSKWQEKISRASKAQMDAYESMRGKLANQDENMRSLPTQKSESTRTPPLTPDLFKKEIEFKKTNNNSK